MGDSSKLVHQLVGSVPQLLISKAQNGTKENDVCANRGACDLTSGICNCYTGFTTSDGTGKFGNRGDCGAAQTTITACPVRFVDSVCLVFWLWLCTHYEDPTFL